MEQKNQPAALAKNLRPSVFNKIIRRLLERIVNCWASGQNFYFPQKFTWRWKLGMLSGKYEPETTAWFKKNIRPGMTIIDIGAHIGYYTRLFSDLAGPTGKIFSFEPEPENFRLLEKNTSGLKNVKIFNLAISDQNGEIAFYKVKNSTGCHSIIPQPQADAIKVKAVSLDDFLAGLKIGRIDLIKIDIEGGETLAFRGMEKLFSLPGVLSLVMEFSPTSLAAADINPVEFLKKIKNYGFNVSLILKHGRTEPQSLDNIENLNWHRTGCVNLLLKK